ncbi:MAG: DinB family protein [Acidimicrobiia bacterium]|nr:DinB family protein [Acidimicrobiia bacterium]
MTDHGLTPFEGYTRQVGRFVAMLADGRSRLRRDLETLDESQLDRTLPWQPNSIGTLLYHVAAIELDWTFADIRETTQFPDGTSDWFPTTVREEGGRLSPVSDSLQGHLDRLAWTREHLLVTLGRLTDDDLDRIVTNADDGSTNGIAWILHHLIQHEAEHRGQIGEIRAALRAR